MNPQDLGRRGEEIAAAYLQQLGYLVLDRRYRFDRAELDVVCFQPRADGRPGGELIFVEVKTRSGLRYGEPEAAVGPDKQRSIVKAARAYLYERKMEGALCRFDVIAIRLDRSGDGQPDVTHIKHAFTS